MKNKGVTIILGILLLFFLLTSTLYFLYQRQLVINYKKHSLVVLSKEKSDEINFFIDHEKEMFDTLSSMKVFADLINDPNNPSKYSAAKEMINELKNVMPGIGVLSKKGIILAAENNPPGNDYSGLSIFPANDKSTTTFLSYYDLTRKKDYYGMLGPVYDKSNKNKVIGIIGFDIPLDKISNLMEANTSNMSEEVYLINAQGLLLSNLKYFSKDNKTGILVQQVSSDGAKKCFADLKQYTVNGIVSEHTEDVIEYVNYAGDEVFGTHAATSLGCVIAEENINDVYRFSMKGFLNWLKGNGNS